MANITIARNNYVNNAVIAMGEVYSLGLRASVCTADGYTFDMDKVYHIDTTAKKRIYRDRSAYAPRRECV